MTGRLCVYWMTAALLCVAMQASAELEQLTLGGELRILGEYYRNLDVSPEGEALRWPAVWLTGRPVGTGSGNGVGIVSPFRFDRPGNDYTAVTQWIRLRAGAHFTGGVAALIELDSLRVWGDDFRSDYRTGSDFRPDTAGDVGVYQAYIEADDLLGLPLRARVGRQELVFGSGWLVGANDSGPAPEWGLSFDALRLTWSPGPLTVDVFSALLAEGGIAEQDGDVTFHGVYASAVPFDALTLDVYWFFLRDARRVIDTNGPWFTEWIEDLLGLDDYDPTTIHTLGLRAEYARGGFTAEAEAAWQTGNAGQQGALFAPFAYGDNDARFDAYGLNLDVIYAFDTVWSPMVYAGYTRFSGEDRRGLSFWNWLNPFDRPRASVSFNRLFSDHSLSDILDITDMSNAQVVRAGVTLAPTESVEIDLTLKYLRALEPFDSPVTLKLGRFRVPVAPVFSFWTRRGSRELGVEASAYVTYAYSEDLTFTAGWSRLFTGPGLRDGSFTVSNGLEFNGGGGTANADYFNIEAVLAF